MFSKATVWRKLVSTLVTTLLVVALAPAPSALAEVSPTPSASADPSASTTPTASSTPAPTASSTPAPTAEPAAEPASVGTPTVNINVSITADGTPTWDADSAAGNDSGPNNGIVRVNDTVTYAIQYNVTDAMATNVVFSITLPKGMEIATIPGYCKTSGVTPVSSLTPTSAGTPTLPLSATSIDQMSQQTLTCNVGDFDAANGPVSNTVALTAKVLNLAHQGQALTVVDADITADGVATPATDPTLPTVTASSRLKWDVSKNGVALTTNSGYLGGPYIVPCPTDATRNCLQYYYPMLLSAPAGGKGAMPAIGDITMTDDVSPRALFPGLTEAQYLALEANPAVYGVEAVAKGTPAYTAPGAKITGALTSVDSVRDSGRITSTHAPGVASQITITNADMTLMTYPTQASNPAGLALPGTNAYAVSGHLQLFIPMKAVMDFGTKVGNVWTLQTKNTLSNLSINGFEPTDHETSADQPTWNDSRTGTGVLALVGSFGKAFIGVPGAAGNMTPAAFSPSYGAYEGPPGGSTIRSGNITVAPTQQVISMLTVLGSNSSLPATISQVSCDSWDPSLLQLRAADYPASTVAITQYIPSGGAAVWLSGYNNVPYTAQNAQWAHTAAEAPTLTVQYSATPGGTGAASTCGDDAGPWYDNPADVPGNDAALAATGVYSAVSRVRTHVVLPPPTALETASGGGVRAFISIGMQVTDTAAAAGTIIPNWAAEKRVNFETLTQAQVLADAGAWSASSYIPGTAASNGHAGTPGDRLILAPAQARIAKTVRKGTSGTFSDTPPQVTGGDTVQYQLSPSLTSGALTTGILKDVWVEDCLPTSQSYLTASVVPTVVTVGSTPTDAKRGACAAGETYIRWVLADHEVNQVIEPIILSVEVSPTVDDGVYNNTVVVWGEGDGSTLAQRSDNAQIQLANVAGIKLEKVAKTPVVQTNRVGSATLEENIWAVAMTNTLPATTVPTVFAPDVIDVLPKQAVNGTSFAGTFSFVRATVTDGGDTVQIRYTSAATVEQDPGAASNGAAGATAWCDAPVNGTLVSGTGACPTSAATVTAVRVTRPGAFLSGEKIGFEVVMAGVGNEAGDTYVNSTFARAEGLEFPVGPVTRAETVISSSLGDYAWWDLNHDGVQNDAFGAAEPPASGVVVTLSGTDDLGNAVTVSTTTDASGKYLFDGLRASDATGYTVTFTKPASASGFTTKHVADADVALDSNADTITGASDPVVLGASAQDLTIDAGFLADGALVINKLLEGVGVKPFGADDQLTFTVVCSFNGAEVLNTSVDLDVNGATSVTSDELGPLPAYSTCVVTETAKGDADSVPAPVTVTVPWDATAQAAGVVTASLTNYYSAGRIAVSKVLQGDRSQMADVEALTFTVLVTCQITEPDAEGTAVTTAVFSGTVNVKGGETVDARDASGNLVLLPVGARCFGVETVDGGATTAVVDHATADNALIVVAGSPDALQQLTLTATNTFACTPTTCAKLAYTGTGALSLGMGGLLLIMIGVGLMGVASRKRRPASASAEGDQQ